MDFFLPKFFKKYFLPVTLLLIAACESPAKLIKHESAAINIIASDRLNEDVSVLQLIEPYKTDLEKEMKEVIIISESVFEKGQPESALGNLVADIVLQKTNERYRPADYRFADFCLLNNGGLRASLPQGEITVGKIFELMPFENEIVVVTLSGEKTAQLIQYVIMTGGQPVSGIEIRNMNQPDYAVFIKGEKFDKAKTYKVATSDYLYGGGDKMDFFKDALNMETTGYKIRDAIIDYLREENAKGNKLKLHQGRRITNEQ